MDITIISDNLYFEGPLTLAKAIREKGEHANIIMPLFEKEYHNSGIKFNLLGQFNILLPFGYIKFHMYNAYIESVPCLFISNNYFFSKKQKRTAYEEAQYISAFSHAALEAFKYINFYPNYIFTDSYRVASIPILMKLKYHYIDNYNEIKTLHYINDTQFGIYNRSFAQNVFGADSDTMHIMLCTNEVNLTKGAILCATRIFVGENGVSILYDKNSSVHHAAVQFGFKIRKLRMGIDEIVFDPEKDPQIHTNYSSSSIQAKVQNKLMIQKHYGLAQDENTPLIILYPYRSRDIITRIMKDMMRCDIQVIILYSEEFTHRSYHSERSAFPKKTVCETSLDIITLKNVFSASDFAVFGGLYSPYGNPSFIASSYGCVPVIASQRFFDCGISYFNKITLDGNGYTYDKHIPQDILYTLWDALGVYRHDKRTYYKLVQNCMNQEFGQSDAVEKIIGECYALPQ